MNTKIDSITRLKSIMIDVFFICAIAIPLVATALFLELNSKFLFLSFILAFVFSVILCKDSVNAQSIGKYKCKLQITNMDDSKVSLIKLIIRNLFIIIWPFELLFCIINPERRIADWILGTRLIYNKTDKKEIRLEKKSCIIFAVMTLFFTILFFIIAKMAYMSNNMIKLLYS